VHGIDVDSLAMLERMDTGLASSGMWPVIASLHISRRIRFSGEMCLNRLDDRPQGNSQTIAQGRSFKL
jgi:hypothetical protein